jgi:hypothetical protein
MSSQCDVCGRINETNQNFYHLTDLNGKPLKLCGLHAEAGKIIAKDNKIDCRIMRFATLRLNKLRPNIRTEPEKWVDWDPLDTLVTLYHDVSLRKPDQKPEKSGWDFEYGERYG